MSESGIEGRNASITSGKLLIRPLLLLRIRMSAGDRRISFIRVRVRVRVRATLRGAPSSSWAP